MSLRLMMCCAVPFCLAFAPTGCSDDDGGGVAVEPGCELFGGPSGGYTLRTAGASFDLDDATTVMLAQVQQGSDVVFNAGAFYYTGEDPGGCLGGVSFHGGPDELVQPYPGGEDLLFIIHDGKCHARDITLGTPRRHF